MDTLYVLQGYYLYSIHCFRVNFIHFLSLDITDIICKLIIMGLKFLLELPTCEFFRAKMQMTWILNISVSIFKLYHNLQNVFLFWFSKFSISILIWRFLVTVGNKILSNMYKLTLPFFPIFLNQNYVTMLKYLIFIFLEKYS